jgi:hypothetical protein
VRGFFEHGNESSVPYKILRNILEAGDWRLLKKKSASYS